MKSKADGSPFLSFARGQGSLPIPSAGPRGSSESACLFRSLIKSDKELACGFPIHLLLTPSLGRSWSNLVLTFIYCLLELNMVLTFWINLEYMIYWNSYAAFNDYRQLRIPLPLTSRQMMWATDVGLGRCTC